MASIVTLTLNPAIDKSADVDRVVPERKMRCGEPSFEPGGGGINVSRAIHNLGGASTAYYMAGGPTGQMLEHFLDEGDLQHRPIPVAAWTRENFIAREDTSTLQYRFGMPGPAVQEDEWKRALEILDEIDPPPEYLVLSGSVPPGVPDDIYARLARTANEHGTRVVADTSGPALHALLDESVYLLKPNIGELAALRSGGDETQMDDSQVEEATAELIEEGICQVVVVSLGAGGALVATREGHHRMQAPTVPVQSKVGAGDSMVGGIVLGLLRGLSPREAARFGVAAGTAAVMSPGTELCGREDTEHLYEQMKAREAVSS